MESKRVPFPDPGWDSATLLALAAWYRFGAEAVHPAQDHAARLAFAGHLESAARDRAGTEARPGEG
jgi:hypothetical protein